MKVYFANATEVAKCIDKSNRYSRMGIAAQYKSKFVTVTNMLPTMTEAFSNGTISTSKYKYTGKSIQITGNTSAGEVTLASTNTYTLNNTHKYYARVEILQSTVTGASSFYWPVAEPNMYSSKKVKGANLWTVISSVKDRSSFDNGTSGKVRLDFDNSKAAGDMWFDGAMLIDLTEAFGTGNEPTATWCDENIPYFTGSMTVDASDLDFTKYEFMLTYPRLSDTLYNRWIQTSPPSATAVTGFVPITTAWSAHNAGIRTNGSSSVYNCDSGSTWYAPLGQTVGWTNNSIPGADGSQQFETELWIRVDTLGTIDTASNYNANYLTSSNFIEI